MSWRHHANAESVGQRYLIRRRKYELPLDIPDYDDLVNQIWLVFRVDTLIDACGKTLTSTSYYLRGYEQWQDAVDSVLNLIEETYNEQPC